MEPTTLLEAVAYFASPANCREYMVPRRWPNGVVTCPTCGSENVKFSEKHNRWQCASHHERRQFTLKTGTIMEDSPIGLSKWLPAIWLLASNRNGISSWELHRALGVTQKTAWFMLSRIRLAMQDESHGGKLAGEVEIDESFIGGKARNMHAGKRAEKIGSSRGTDGKEIVLGMKERDGRVRAMHVEKRSKPVLQKHIRDHVEAGAAIFTDALKSYDGLDEFGHSVVDHTVEYVRGNVHTNGMENFWAILKRGLKGTYVSAVEPFHLHRYLDEQCFRFNNRLPMRDADRFSLLVRKIVGKRLTYAKLTGKTRHF